MSRSGRIRKKSSKLADFESSDEIENHGGGAAGGSGSATPTMRRPRSANSSLDSIGALNQPKSSYMVDSIPPHQLLAEEEVKREEDEFKTEEEEYEDEDDFDMEAVEDIKEEDFDAIPFVGVDDDDDEEDDVANRVQAQVVYKEEGEEAEVDVENDGDDEGDERNLMIDERKRQPKKSLYFSEKTAKTKRNADGEAVAKKTRKDKGKTRITAYMLWAKSVRGDISATNPGMDFTAISKKLGEVWATVSTSDKYNWKRRAKRWSVKLRMKQAALAQAKKAELKKRIPESKQTQMAHFSFVAEQVANSDIYKVVGTDPINTAAHLKLLGESLSVIGQRLTEHDGQIAVSGSLSVLLDSLLCAMGPLVCLTKQVPQLNVVPQDNLNKILDNIAYIMPGL